MTKEELLVLLLKERALHIAFAESCTAGLACARLVNIPSASAVLDASFITYANEAKIRLVGVKPESLAAYGAVSETVAGEMAEGAARAAGAEIGVGISGIAGPGGGSREKPVGTVAFGFFIDGVCHTVKKQFGDLGRAAVRAAAVEFVYDTLLALLSE